MYAQSNKAPEEKAPADNLPDYRTLCFFFSSVPCFPCRCSCCCNARYTSRPTSRSATWHQTLAGAPLPRGPPSPAAPSPIRLLL